MKRRAHLAGFAVLIALSAAPVFGAATASVSGDVRDSSGTPQIGATVQLLRSDLTVVTTVYTDGKGHFAIASLLPGHYSLKAMGPTFLPSLREDVRVRRGTIVNLTLNTLYEVMQWLPSQPRSGTAQEDDWAWTLRSASNRPLLRWLEDGPLVVVSDGSGSHPKLRARLVATGQDGTFGESGERYTATIEDTPVNSRELLARVDFSPNSDAGMESMLGFRQDLGFAGAVQSVAAIAIHPDEADGSGDQGFTEAVVRTAETLHLGPDIQGEVGSSEVLGRFDGQSPDTVAVGLPFATVEWHNGDSAVRYRMATMVEQPGADDAAMPRFAIQNGNLVVERGMHQELGWEHNTDSSSMAVMVYTDTVSDPILEAMTRFASVHAAPSPVASSALLDPSSSMLRAAGPAFSTAGVEAVLERQLPHGNRIRLSYANGDALVMPALPSPASFTQILGTAHAHRSQSYSISLSGTLEGTGTRWRASYRWQPDETVTAVAPFAENASLPYLNLHLRQPIHISRDGSSGLEALLEVRNLLAQGYRPYILSDGSLLMFAQDQRGIRAGLAFTF
jgi:hypothetical protein